MKSVENLISNIEYKLENISQNAEEKNKRWKWDGGNYKGKAKGSQAKNKCFWGESKTLKLYLKKKTKYNLES